MKTLHLNRWCIWLLATPVTLGTASATFAKNERSHGREPQGHGYGQGKDKGYDRERDRGRYEAPNGFRYQYRDDPIERGGGSEHDFRVGQRLPPAGAIAPMWSTTGAAII